MSEYILYNGELYHHGVKGMKWGHRKFQTKSNELDKKRAAYDQARKAYKKSVRKTGRQSLLAYSPNKQHRDIAVNNVKKMISNANKVKTAKKQYKEAKKEFRKNTTVGQKIGRAFSVNGAKTAAKTVAKIGSLYVADQAFNNGRGTAAVKSVINTIGRASITAYKVARGGTDIRWFDN